ERLGHCGQLGDDVLAGALLLDHVDHGVELTARTAQPVEYLLSRIGLGHGTPLSTGRMAGWTPSGPEPPRGGYARPPWVHRLRPVYPRGYICATFRATPAPAPREAGPRARGGRPGQSSWTMIPRIIPSPPASIIS